jgi:hypothetical protein
VHAKCRPLLDAGHDVTLLDAEFGSISIALGVARVFRGRLRRDQRWYHQMGRRVWFHDVFGFFFRGKRVKHGPTVEHFWGATLAHEEEALARPSAGERRLLQPRPAEPASG